MDDDDGNDCSPSPLVSHFTPPLLDPFLSCSPPLSRIRLLYTIRTLVSKRYFTTKKVQKVNMQQLGKQKKYF